MRRLYALVRQGVLDDPGHDPGRDGPFEDLATFRERLFDPYYWDVRDGVALAWRGTAWVGLSQVGLEGDVARCGLTVVDRAHRGRGLALALKASALARARAAGAVRAVTRVDAANAPMLAVARRLGFASRS